MELSFMYIYTQCLSDQKDREISTLYLSWDEHILPQKVRYMGPVYCNWAATTLTDSYLAISMQQIRSVKKMVALIIGNYSSFYFCYDMVMKLAWDMYVSYQHVPLGVFVTTSAIICWWMYVGMPGTSAGIHHVPPSVWSVVGEQCGHN